MIPGLVFVLFIAVLDWIAVARNWRKVELLAKPATMVALFLVFAMVGRFSSSPLWCFGAGIVFSLGGDIFLLLSDRWFIAGLFVFLLGHLSYITGFNLHFPVVSPFWSIGIAFVLALVLWRILGKIISGIKEKGFHQLIIPVVVYGTVISIMLFSAMLTVFRQEWKSNAAMLACLGAFLFYVSDIILAWNKFVAPIRNGRIANMITYNLGQIALIAGVLIQFSK